MTNTNGHNGEWSTLTLPDSGATLEYRRVSHMLLADVSNSIDAPTPPMQEVDYGGKVRQEPNPSHPDYLRALSHYRQKQADKVLAVAVQVGVQVEINAQRIFELREQFKEMGVELPVNDKVLYVTRVLCETGNDLTALRDAIIRKSQPTEAAIAEKIETFPSDIQADRPIPDTDA